MHKPSTKYMNNERGFSLPSVIVGSAIAAILSAVAFTSMWSSVDNSKVRVISSLITEQRTLFNSAPYHDYDQYKIDINNPDYLEDLVSAGLLTAISENLFNSPNELTWEIRMLVFNGHQRVFYTIISSTNPDDQDLIDKAISSTSLDGSFIYRTTP